MISLRILVVHLILTSFGLHGFILKPHNDVLLRAASTGGMAPSPPNCITHRTMSRPLHLLRRLFRKRSKNRDAPGEILTDEEVSAMFSLWNDALATCDSRLVAARYASNAILLPTVSDEPRTDYDSIKNYFDSFLLKKPKGEIIESHIRAGKGWAKDSGIYEFLFRSDGTKVRGRYSFVYVKENDKWKILHHHSSVMPEGITIAEEITETQVKNFFLLWNEALATGDPDVVVRRYAKNAVLLSTTSGTPRNTPELIKDFYSEFLLLRPQAKILESNIDIGTNWAQDTGIFEFTMGNDGSKLKARYSFVYVLEEGSWKISHHHSSMMPEGLTKAIPITEYEVRALFDRWNDALATGDPKKVTACYAEKAVLLPTVSDSPRTTQAMIEDYFTSFLKRKPAGVIKKGYISIGANWAQDAGVYQFTMGDDGSKVLARYSFVYVHEDGDWKISHHHSSVMPEAILANTDSSSEKIPIETNGSSFLQNIRGFLSDVVKL